MIWCGWAQQLTNCLKNKFGIPDILFEPCLLLCPHINLLTLMFANKVFAPSALTTPKQLFNLCILPRKNQIKLPLKEEKKNVPLFCVSENTAYGVWISRDKSFVNSTFRPRLIALGSVTGIELPISPYTFWRDNGEAFNNSSELQNQDQSLRQARD